MHNVKIEWMIQYIYRNNDEEFKSKHGLEVGDVFTTETVDEELNVIIAMVETDGGFAITPVAWQGKTIEPHEHEKFVNSWIEEWNEKLEKKKINIRCKRDTLLRKKSFMITAKIDES